MAIVDMEGRALMLAWKESSAGEVIHQRPRVAAWNVHAFVRSRVVIPDDGDAMRSVLTGQAEYSRKPLRRDVFESNETDTRNGMAVVQLRRNGAGS